MSFVINLACSKMKVFVEDTASLHIECYSRSCIGMEIIVQSNPTSVNIHCDEYESCTGMIASFDYISADNRNTTITCYSQNACTDLQISADNQFMKLNMFEYSENIIINNSYGYSDEYETVKCDLDSKYIKYEFGISNISELVEQEYQNNLLPCQDIHITSSQGECVMRYRMVDESTLDQEFGNVVGNIQSIVL